MKRTKIVVTGGAGFIGSAFINYIKDNYDAQIVCVDNLTYAGNLNNIKHDVELIKKDICDLKFEDLGEHDYLVHFAAESHVDNSISNGLPFIKTNVEGTFNLLELSRKNSILKKFVHISTDEVYGDLFGINNNNYLASENSPLKPSSYYSSSKASSDLLVLSSNHTYGLPYLITRTCNNFGEHQHPEKFLPKIADSIKNEKTIPVYGNGKQVREWIYVYDNVRIICDLMFDDNVINTIFNIGSSFRCKNISIVEKISTILNKKLNIEFVKDRLGHDKRYGLDSTKIEYYYTKNSKKLKFEHLFDFLQKNYG